MNIGFKVTRFTHEDLLSVFEKFKQVKTERGVESGYSNGQPIAAPWGKIGHTITKYSNGVVIVSTPTGTYKISDGCFMEFCEDVSNKGFSFIEVSTPDIPEAGAKSVSDTPEGEPSDPADESDK